MAVPPLPFEILGQVGPILAWTEGGAGQRLPSSWSVGAPQPEREREWLLRQLPSYSYDNVDDVIAAARALHPAGAGAHGPHEAEPSLSPPRGYDLLQTFRYLHDYFFVWNGTELCVRENRMEDLHELALRFPASHFVRHGHARAISEGVMRFEEALVLPELVTLLPSNSFGLRSIVRQGLSESHLHLTAVISADETWADNLLRPRTARAIGGGTLAERRLLVLNFFAGRLLALALAHSWWRPRGDVELRPPNQLLQLLDRVYFARSRHQEHQAIEALERGLAGWIGPAQGKTDLAQGETDPGQGKAVVYVPAEHEFLLRWLAPSVDWLQGMISGRLRREALVGRRQRYRLVHQLHLAAHLRLVQLSPSSAVGGRAASGRDSDRAAFDERAAQRSFLHEALFRYLVCRTHHWQQATQQGRTTGLRHFRGYYGSPHRSPRNLSHQQYADLVLDRLVHWRGLRVLEGRVAPPRSAQQLVPWVRAYVRQSGKRLRKLGLVIHFKKEDESREDRPLGGWSASPYPRLRWVRRRRVVREEGLRIYRLLQQPLPVTPFVVGIDACNLELATPPEVFGPVFRFLRELPISLDQRSRHYSPYFEIDTAIRELVQRRRLGMTYHVGEDFRHLLSGLRAIDEVVTFLAPKPGDRLGHGTALALAPEGWLERNGYQAVLSKMEWLDTLVWVHHFLGPGHQLVGELAIEDEIQRLSWDIYGDALPRAFDPLGLASSEADEGPRQRGRLDRDWSPLTLWDAWLLRQLDPGVIDVAELFRGRMVIAPPHGLSEENRRWHSIQQRTWAALRPQIGSRNAYLLLGLYWLSPVVRERGGERFLLDMRSDRGRWLELCRAVGEKMKRRIRDHELVVEVNPSSNRIIGPMESYDQHHVFQLTLDEDRQLSRDVRVSINTDNPAVCNTTLAHEYYLLGEVLMKQGAAEAEVTRWLEWLRRNGEDYNFARRLNDEDEDPSMARLMNWLRHVRPTVREAATRQEKFAAFWAWMSPEDRYLPRHVRTLRPSTAAPAGHP